jgi:hypothetical protein
MSVLVTILAAAEHAAGAAEHEEKSELPFFLAGGALALFAIVVSVIGFRTPSFPANADAARGVMTLGVALTVTTMASILYVAS